MALGQLHLIVLKELDNVIVRLLSIDFEKLWWLAKSQMVGRKKMSYATSSKARRTVWGITGWSV